MFNKICKKLSIGVVTFSLFSMVSFGASAMMDDDSDLDTVYLSVGYQALWVGQQNIDAAKVATVSGTTPTLTSTAYNPNYSPNFLGLHVGVGKSFSGEARAEFEIAMNTQAEIDNSAKQDYFDTLSTPAAFVNQGFKYGAAMINVYYDIDSGKSAFLVPYIGGGIGLARVSFLSNPTSESITYPIAVQLKAGVQIKPNDSMIPIYLGYKMVYLAKKELSDEIASFLPSNTPASGTGTSATAATTALTIKPKVDYLLHQFDAGIIISR